MSKDLVRVGELRHRITFQRPVTTTDPVTGEAVKSWVNVSRTYAKKQTAQAKTDQPGVQQTTTTLTLTMRFLTVDPTWAVMVDDSRYAIASAVDPEGERRWLIVTANLTN